MNHVVRLLACTAALTSVGACVAFERTPGVLFATKPAGARIVVDGADSGFVTPCALDLEREHHVVDLQLDGYQPARLLIDERGETWIMHYNEAWLDYHTWHFPLWLNFYDFVAPIRIERGYTPERIYVPLKLVERGDRPRRAVR